MKKTVVLFFVLFSLTVWSQEKIEPTDQFAIEGLVKNPIVISLSTLSAYKAYSTDSVVITSHLMQKKHTVKNLKGVLLKDILEKAEIQAPSPKVLSEYYIVCIASDNYKVIFSWNELFNTGTGQTVYVLTQLDGKPAASTEERITLFSTNDMATGRRFVKGLKKIVVERVR